MTATPTHQLSTNLLTLIEKIHATKDLTPANCKNLLIEADLSAEELLPWAEFDHPAADSYGRNLLFDGGRFELMVMSWAPGDMSAIHDHGYTQWGAVQVFGTAEHAMFKKRNDVLITIDRRDFEPDTVVAVAHDLIHQMGNSGDQQFLSLHLYGCDHRNGDITADARLYEPAEEAVQITSGGVFFALPEDKVTRRIDNLQTDFSTLVRHRVELIKRLLKMGPAGEARRRLEQRKLFSRETWNTLRSELELNDSSSRTCESIRCQELQEMAKLQFRLSAENVLDDDVSTDELRQVLATESTTETANAYLRLAERAHSISLNRAVVAA